MFSVSWARSFVSAGTVWLIPSCHPGLERRPAHTVPVRLTEGRQARMDRWTDVSPQSPRGAEPCSSYPESQGQEAGPPVSRDDGPGLGDRGQRRLRPALRAVWSCVHQAQRPLWVRGATSRGLRDTRACSNSVPSPHPPGSLTSLQGGWPQFGDCSRELFFPFGRKAASH